MTGSISIPAYLGGPPVDRPVDLRRMDAAARRSRFPLSEITEEADWILRYTPDASYVVGVEVGVLRGKSATICLRRRPGLRLLLVDPWRTEGIVADPPGDVRAACIASILPCRDRVALDERPGVEAAADFPDGSADYVFVDGLHDYASVRADLAAWGPKVARGGVLMGHDWSHPKHPEWGVQRAVEEYAATWSPELAPEVGGVCGLCWALRVPK